MDKPRADFPLWWRKDPRCKGGGYWCKHLPGEKRPRGFGADPELAEKLYDEAVEAITKGRDSRVTHSTITVGHCYSDYVDHLHDRCEDGEYKAREFDDRRRWLDHFCTFEIDGRALSDWAVRDLNPDVFRAYLRTLRKEFGLDQRNKRIREVRKMFEQASDEDLIEHPVKFGQRFRPTPGKAMKKIRKKARGKKKTYALKHVRRILSRAPQPLKAMAWLGINCLFGPTDCGLLTLDKVHLRIERDADGRVIKAGGWHDFPRPKNDAVERRCYLFPETALALEEWLEIRAGMMKRLKPKDPAWEKLVFLTLHRRPWVRENVHRDAAGRIEKSVGIDSLSMRWRELCDRLEVPTGFYRLKHTGITWISNLANDDHAECRIRGHYLPGMSRHYVHKIEGKRIRRIVKKLRFKLRRWKVEKAKAVEVPISDAPSSPDSGAAAA